jgi:hypothetical protein
VWTIIFAAFLLAASLPAFAQHDMHNMPGMSHPKPKAKARTKRVPRKKKRATRRRPKAAVAPTHDMHDMPGMTMPAEQPAAVPVAPAPGHVHTPGMQMPSPAPINSQPAAAAQTHTHPPAPGTSPAVSPHAGMSMPGIELPAQSRGAQPAASPQMDSNMPGMNMPASNTPSASNPHAGHQMPMPGASPSPGAMDNMPGMDHGPGMGAMNLGPLLVMNGSDMGIRVGSSANNTVSMGQLGSGTSWQPSSGPMHMHYKVAGDWLLMFHYNFLAGVNHQGGPRGTTKAESANWFMPMAYHKLGQGTVQLRGMFSLEPFSFPPGGSPLLFQTGETYKGQPLIDRQHPHDLFMELSAQYTHPLGEHGTWFTYFGYPGEPALGPVAFMHRLSASENPSATLAHHLQDSTHISFGVLTTGFTYRWLKLEGSVFNGREPDENRYDFDAHKWNSRSARLAIAPNPNWTMQVSYGFLKSPEGSDPTTDIRRTTASVQYNRPFDRGNWASAFVWGRNHTSSPGETHNLNGYTLESTLNFEDKNYLYTRLELVDKNELLRASDRTLLGIADDHPSFRIGAYTFGGARDLWNTDKVSFAVGSDLTFYSKPAILDRLYGSGPVSWKLFFRVRPGKMDMSSHGAHQPSGTTPPHH